MLHGADTLRKTSCAAPTGSMQSALVALAAQSASSPSRWTLFGVEPCSDRIGSVLGPTLANPVSSPTQVHATSVSAYGVDRCAAPECWQVRTFFCTTVRCDLNPPSERAHLLLTAVSCCVRFSGLLQGSSISFGKIIPILIMPNWCDLVVRMVCMSVHAFNLAKKSTFYPEGYSPHQRAHHISRELL